MPASELVGFFDPQHSWCCLATALHLLLAIPAITSRLDNTAPCASTLCPVCLLRATRKHVCSARVPCAAVPRWLPWLASVHCHVCANSPLRRSCCASFWTDFNAATAHEHLHWQQIFGVEIVEDMFFNGDCRRLLPKPPPRVLIQPVLSVVMPAHRNVSMATLLANSIDTQHVLAVSTSPTCMCSICSRSLVRVVRRVVSHLPPYVLVHVPCAGSGDDSNLHDNNLHIAVRARGVAAQ